MNNQDKSDAVTVGVPSIYGLTDCERENQLRVNLCLKNGRNLRKHKTTDIKVTTIGRADISSLPQFEQTVLFSALLKRMNELMRGGEEK